MRNGTRIVETRLICPRCNNVQTIYRKASSKRKFGHLKYLWCYKCKRRINHFEICDEMIEEDKMDLKDLISYGYYDEDRNYIVVLDGNKLKQYYKAKKVFIDKEE